MRSISLLLPALAVAAACGGDGAVEPAIIPGGGIHDPGIDGVLNVFIIDADSDQVIANATVKVGDVEIVTDTTGLVVFDGLTGPQTILVKASGYAASMWVGADGANVTIPMDKTPTPTTTPPQAQLSGSITGWDALPAPAANHFRAALITYSQDPEIGSTANEIDQPPPVNDIPAGACVRLPMGASPPCAWRINARAGTIALGMTVIDIDTRGTAPDIDDITTITGFAVKQPITVVAGSNQTGIAMDPPPANSTTTASIDFGAPPAALTEVFAVAGLDLGSPGVLRLSTADRLRTSTVLPSLSTAGGSTYELVAIAQEAVVDGTAAQSILVRRGITSASGLAAGEWLPPPTGLASDRATASFTRGRAEGPYILEFDTTAGANSNRALSVAILDASSQLTLPATFAPLPAGAVTMRVTTIDTGAPIDLRDFEVDDITEGAVRFSADSIKLP